MMKCTKNIILTAAGILVYNCDKSNNSFTGLNTATDTVATINSAIANGSLRYLPFLKSSDAISANNEDGTSVTDQEDTIQVSSARIGITAMLNSRFGSLMKASKINGAVMGYVVTKEGFIVGQPSADGSTLDMVKIEVSMPSPLPNSAFAGSNMPNVQVAINFGKVEVVEGWRIRAFSGINSAEDLLELEIADLVPLTTTTAKLVDFLGETITGANDVSDASFVYSSGSANTAAISSGVITFTTTVANEVVTCEGSISGYIISKPIVMPS